jgi:hypothetical protein
MPCELARAIWLVLLVRNPMLFNIFSTGAFRVGTHAAMMPSESSRCLFAVVISSDWQRLLASGSFLDYLHPYIGTLPSVEIIGTVSYFVEDGHFHSTCCCSHKTSCHEASNHNLFAKWSSDTSDERQTVFALVSTVTGE